MFAGGFHVEGFGARRDHHPDFPDARLDEFLNLGVERRDRIALAPGEGLDGEVAMGDAR